jgi:asparagine N-glycosylation enzyme membrane subunit Stt3
MITMSVKIRKILTILGLALVMSIALFSFGIAYKRGVSGIGLVGLMFFFTFGIIVVLAQLIPAGILFSSFIGAAISPTRKSEVLICVT